MPDNPHAPHSGGESTPHPAPAKLDDVSLSLLNPLPEEGEGRIEGADRTSNESDQQNNDRQPTLASQRAEREEFRDLRARILAIPGMSDLAGDLGVPTKPEPLHSACISEAPLLPPISSPPLIAQRPRFGSPLNGRTPKVVLRRPR
jgi:hypothetical protein